MVADWRDAEPSEENAAKLFPPKDIGPVWQKDEAGEWLMPEYTIGWDAIVWAEEWLSSPSGDGSPLRFTPEQMRVILWHYSIDQSGKFNYWKTLWQSSKGSGKDPFAAILGVIELIGPCRFSHWVYDDEGNKHPVAREEPAALVQFAGVSKEQTDNTMDLIPTILNQRVRAEYKLDVQKEIVYADGGRRKLKQVGANWAALQGNRATYVVMNEGQHWYPSQGGPKLYDVLKNNVLKTRGHFIMISNAYEPGEDSMHERIRLEQEKVWAGLAQPSGWLYMSREAHPKAPLHPDWLPHVLKPIYGDATWQIEQLGTIAAEVLDGATPASQVRRMFLNQIVASDDALFSQDEWDGAMAEGCIGDERDLSPGDEIVLGFDGGKSSDATALVAIRVKDRLTVPILVEQKPDGPMGDHWEIDRNLVDEEVRRAFGIYKVRAFFADTHLWESYIAMWSEEFREDLAVRAGPKSAIGWDMSGSGNRLIVAEAWDRYLGAIREGHLFHNGNKLLRVHALNAKLGHNGKGRIARKENPDSPRKIDAMVASYVAYAALVALNERGKKPAKQYRRTMMRA